MILESLVLVSASRLEGRRTHGHGDTRPKETSYLLKLEMVNSLSTPQTFRLFPGWDVARTGELTIVHAKREMVTFVRLMIDMAQRVNAVSS
ncbi:MAG: hypothetical protein FWD55_07815 [Propionibacteriaceae bacterium]|nr:hypothetical protein [Propionibacteriaceae bacterium]